MAITNYLTEQHFDFSGGVNQNTSRLLMADNECTVLQNAEMGPIGSVYKVRGFAQKGSDVNTGYNILGMASCYKSDGTQKQIAVADGAASSDAYTYNPITNTWTDHVLSLTSGSKAEFEYFLDGFFMINFTEATRWNNLTQWYTTNNVTDAPKAKYIKLYLSRIYLGYVTDGATTYPSRVIYSNLPDDSASPMTLSWDNSVNYFDVNSDDGDVIKALGENSNRLLIFKEKSMYRYDTNTLYQVPGCPGTVSQRSVKNLQGMTLYLHSSGIWAYNGQTSQLISRNIKDIIAGISTKNLTNACAVASGDHYYLYVGDIINLSADLEIDKCLIDYDISKNSFSWRSLTKEPTCFAIYRDDRSAVTYNSATLTYNNSETTYNGLISSEDRIYFGATDGAVYQLNTGNSYDGTDIPFAIETKDYYLSYPSLYKMLQKIVVFVNGGQGAITVQYKLDDKNWKTLGKITKDQTELIFPAASRCNRVRFRFSDSSSGGRFSFEGFDIYFSAENLTP